MLAEAIQLTDAEASLLLYIFFAFLGAVATACVVAVLGCVWAYRAGRGSKRALKGWIAAGGPFLLALLLAMPTLLAEGFIVFWLPPVSVLVAQGALYGLGRALGPRPTAAGARQEWATR